MVQLEKLTQREREVVQCVAQGMTNKEMAQHFGITPATVNAHLDNIYAKTGVRDRVHLAILATRAPLIAERDAQHTELADLLRKLMHENDELLAENESLQDAYAIMKNVADKRQAEIERLTAAIDRAHPHAEPKPGCALCEELGTVG